MKRTQRRGSLKEIPEDIFRDRSTPLNLFHGCVEHQYQQQQTQNALPPASTGNSCCRVHFSSTPLPDPAGFGTNGWRSVQYKYDKLTPQTPLKKRRKDRNFCIERVGDSQGTVFDKFSKVKRIGSGDFATVYNVTEHNADGKQRFALKVFKRSVKKSNYSLERVKAAAQQEYDTRKKFSLHHPNLVSYFCYIEMDAHVSLQMELCSGGTLNKYLNKRNSEEFIWHVLHNVLSGLTEIHSKGFMHLDIKPDNILEESNEQGRSRYPNFKIGDFGTVIHVNDMQTDTITGDPRYAAPEAVKEHPNLDGRVDVYSLGVIAVQLALPLEPTDALKTCPSELGKLYSTKLSFMIERMLKPDHEERPTSTELLQEISSQTDIHSDLERPRKLYTRTGHDRNASDSSVSDCVSE